MADVKKIIASMTDDVRSKAEAFAKSKGITLEEAVTQQLTKEISDDDLDGVAGGNRETADSNEIEAVIEANIEHSVGGIVSAPVEVPIEQDVEQQL